MSFPGYGAPAGGYPGAVRTMFLLIYLLLIIKTMIVNVFDAGCFGIVQVK